MENIWKDCRANLGANQSMETPKTIYQDNMHLATTAETNLGTGWSGGRVESSGDLSLGILQEPSSIDLARMNADQVEFNWSEQPQLPDNFRISYDSLDFSDDTYSNTHALYENVPNLPISQLYVPDLQEISIDPLNLDLADLSLPLMDSGDFNMSLQQPLDIPINTSISSVCDVPQLLEFIGSHAATPNLSSGLDLTQTPASPTSPKSAYTQRQHRFYCITNGCIKHYKRKHELKRHQKVHSGIKPHGCNISGCNRSGHNGFARRDHLGQHMRKVHGTKLV